MLMLFFARPSFDKLKNPVLGRKFSLKALFFSQNRVSGKSLHSILSYRNIVWAYLNLTILSYRLKMIQ